jgi:hypothetical protein
MKLCDKCQTKLILDKEIWEKEEWANGKHFLLRHNSDRVKCGGSFVLPVSELVRKVGV